MYIVTFTPVTIPDGTDYTVEMAGITKTATAPKTISMSVPSGYYTYTYASAQCGYSPVSQTTDVSSNKSVPLIFSTPIHSAHHKEQNITPSEAGTAEEAEAAAIIFGSALGIWILFGVVSGVSAAGVYSYLRRKRNENNVTS